MRRAVTLVAAVLVTSCTSSDRPQPPVLSPAPIDCPTGIVRADIVQPSEMVDQMNGHVPLMLPEGFGLAEAWGVGEGLRGNVLWADARCREVRVAFSSDTKRLTIDGPKVGAWTVTVDAPGQCGNGVLGDARCLGYAATAEDGTLIVQMMGLNRAEGDEIVLSIPLERH